MKILTQVIQRILSKFGYQLIQSEKTSIVYDNFTNLVQAYEQRLNELDDSDIPTNKIRPKLLARLLGTPPSEAYFIIQALIKTKDIDGDICEFGVAQGEMSALIANELSAYSTKTLHLFDSFQGLPKPTEKDKLKDDIFSLGSMDAYTGAMSCPEDMVQKRLKAISFPTEGYIIHKGFIEQLINTDNNFPKSVSFAYIDFDFYEPIKISLEYLHNVTPIGAIIIVDDYNFFSTGVKTAVDEWLAEKNLAQTIYDCYIPNTYYGHFCILTKNQTDCII
ncbi:MAG: TylF/MycF family methyltransferase [gamma proteobacterium symbiont of Taylorina sp.]|nr:TylF/MycF family methyltransferase [gamma proteobacterium symbiont of Taylorina sp.]